MDAAQEVVIQIDVDRRSWSDCLVLRIPRHDLYQKLLRDAELDILADVPPVLAQVEDNIRAGLADVAVIAVEAAGIPDPALETVFPAREDRFE